MRTSTVTRPSRRRRGTGSPGYASGVDVPGRRRDHRRVVGAELRRRQGQPDAQLVGSGARPPRAARSFGPRRRRRQRSGAGGLDRLGRPLDQGADDRRLIGRGQVGGRAGVVADGAGERGLQAAEREVVAGAAHHRRGKARAPPASPPDARAARAPRRPDSRARAGGRPCRTPRRRRRRGCADHRHVAARLDRREQRVAARREQRQERRLDRIGLEVEGGDVAVQVVDGDQRQAAGEGERLGGREADEERADQARALGDGHRRDVVQASRPRRRARAPPRARRAPGAGATRPPERRRRTARAAPPAS